jgi:hypothetical protein
MKLPAGDAACLPFPHSALNLGPSPETRCLPSMGASGALALTRRSAPFSLREKGWG